MTELYSRLAGETMLGVQQQDKYLFVNAVSTVIPEGIRAVEATVSAAVTLTLPSVAASAGMFLHIYALTSGGFDLTVTDAGDDAAWVNVVSSDNGINELFLYSTGRHWLDVGCSCGVLEGQT